MSAKSKKVAVVKRKLRVKRPVLCQCKAKAYLRVCNELSKPGCKRCQYCIDGHRA